MGIPGDSAPRAPEPGQKGTPPSNAVIGYIQEFGDDEKHIPARPFLVPGVENARPAIVKGMENAARAAFSAQPSKINDGLHEAGLSAEVSVKKKMIDGPFAPLSDRTIEARARRRNSETGKLLGDGRSKDARSFLKLRAEGVPDDVLHDAGLAKPLLDTYDLQRSVTHVIKDR
ncbi:hypothetical protein [Lichenibacterium dinghuense]|uniref:hypothetical protein n=1 Tax=Lichenibacterium dinghuense TaxID=2895977 RepID=UPI001F2D0905|nr:hypothetical protein [Lichenibacterium sp. 6Y81]